MAIKDSVSDTVSVSGRAEKTKTEDTEDTAAAAVVWSHEIDDDCWDGREASVTTACQRHRSATGLTCIIL